MGDAFIFQNIKQSPSIVYINATGGTTLEYDDGGKRYRSHTFTSVGTSTFTVTELASDTELNILDYLIIAGGGGGGSHYYAGGGGAGGYRTTLTPTPGNTNPNAKVIPSLSSYSIVVGNGGAMGTSGQNSSAFNIISTGGGFGRGTNGSCVAASGGSGGSGGGSNTACGGVSAQSGGTGISGQGFNGGVARTHGSGGGGAGQVGRDGHNDATKGTGGNGLASKIRSGVDEFRAGGGAGAIDANFPPSGSPTRVDGGLGGGGYSAGSTSTSGSWDRSPQTTAAPGAANTGSGGGGGLHDTNNTLRNGAPGGSGIVIVRYEIAPV